MPSKIENCRLCRGSRLDICIELGDQCLTGVFPKSSAEQTTRGPLTLVRCEICGLVQLCHSYDPADLYGPNYGYRSGLNRSMVEHLRSTVETLQRRVTLGAGDIVVDIGSNDGTTLSFYPRSGPRLVGFDPSMGPFRHYYREDIRGIADFFSAARFREEFGADARVKLVTSLAMFYDLEDPMGFVSEIESLLTDDGVWHFEQSYLPTMLAMNAYDTICHEHLEYYAVKQIKRMTDRAGLKILDISLNGTNGGSFAITAAKRAAPYPENVAVVEGFLEREAALGLDGPAVYSAFKDRVFRHREQLLDKLHRLKESGRVVFGYGASTKGNVILQFCGLDRDLLPCIAEINEQKFGCVTPGSRIPIVSEAEAKARKPDCFLVLPWHFKTNLLHAEAQFLRDGGAMLFPLPEIEVVS